MNIPNIFDRDTNQNSQEISIFGVQSSNVEPNIFGLQNSNQEPNIFANRTSNQDTQQEPPCNLDNIFFALVSEECDLSIEDEYGDDYDSYDDEDDVYSLNESSQNLINTYSIDEVKDLAGDILLGTIEGCTEQQERMLHHLLSVILFI